MCFNLTDEQRCRICQDSRRDHGLICVVEEPSDVIPMERTHEYSGVYHVLGGALSPIDGIDPEDLHIAELLARAAPGAPGANGAGGAGSNLQQPSGGVHNRDQPPVREVILATNPTTTGETTALHIAEELRVRAPSSRSHVWPAACRSARTSSTPTRSPSARPLPGAEPCNPRPMAGLVMSDVLLGL